MIGKYTEIENRDKAKQQLISESKRSLVYLVEENETIIIKKQLKGENSYLNGQKEFFILKELNHKNILKVLDFEGQNLYLEYIENKELFQYLIKSPFQENVAKFYFSQLIDALIFMHQKNIAHRDLKTENIMIDSQFNLKVIDFDIACKYENNKYLNEIIGTELYSSPEMHRNVPYDPQKNDVFACGVILFIMLFGHPPMFNKATAKDDYYRFFIEKKEKQFFKQIQIKNNITVSDDVLELLEGMLEYNQSSRYSLEKIYSSQWLRSNNKFNNDEIIKFMKNLQSYFPKQ